MEGSVAMSGKERHRLRVVQAVDERRMTQGQAAQALNVSVRHVKRLAEGMERFWRGRAGVQAAGSAEQSAY